MINAIVRGLAFVLLVGCVVLAEPRAALANSPLAPPTGLHQIGVDEHGYPVLAWTLSPDDPGFGYYTVLYDSLEDPLVLHAGSGRPNHATSNDAWGHCIAEGTYVVTVSFVSTTMATSPPSNSLELKMPRLTFE